MKRCEACTEPIYRVQHVDGHLSWVGHITGRITCARSGMAHLMRKKKGKR